MQVILHKRPYMPYLTWSKFVKSKDQDTFLLVQSVMKQVLSGEGSDWREILLANVPPPHPY